jgi:myo-inositol-1(or 4)-monophosphatase
LKILVFWCQSRYTENDSKIGYWAAAKAPAIELLERGIVLQYYPPLSNNLNPGALTRPSNRFLNHFRYKKENMKNLSPAQLTVTAIQAALKAGELLRHGFGTSFTIQHKAGKQNLVTEYDTAAEACIMRAISERFPEHAFLAEESGSSHKSSSSSPVLWVIDPLDGTVNFAHHIPIFSISIAAAIEDKVVSGVVYQPITRELFVAEINQGAYLNGVQLKVSNTAILEEAMVATGFPYNVDENPLQCIDRFAQMVEKGVPIRRLGSAALDLSYLAASRFDAYWEVSLHPWDLAAGKLIVEEAGGKVTHWDGRPHSVFCHETILASNGPLHPTMITHLNQPIKP